MFQNKQKIINCKDVDEFREQMENKDKDKNNNDLYLNAMILYIASQKYEYYLHRSLTEILQDINSTNFNFVKRDITVSNSLMIKNIVFITRYRLTCIKKNFLNDNIINNIISFISRTTQDSVNTFNSLRCYY